MGWPNDLHLMQMCTELTGFSEWPWMNVSHEASLSEEGALWTFSFPVFLKQLCQNQPYWTSMWTHTRNLTLLCLFLSMNLHTKRYRAEQGHQSLTKSDQISFIYLSLSQINNLPQGASQTVQQMAPSVLRPSTRMRNNPINGQRGGDLSKSNRGGISLPWLTDVQ